MNGKHSKLYIITLYHKNLDHCSNTLMMRGKFTIYIQIRIRSILTYYSVVAKEKKLDTLQK